MEESVQLHAPAALPSGKSQVVPTQYNDGWPPQPSLDTSGHRNIPTRKTFLKYSCVVLLEKRSLHVGRMEVFQMHMYSEEQDCSTDRRLQTIHFWHGVRTVQYVFPLQATFTITYQQINPLSAKLYVSNLKTHFVPRSKHSLLRF